MSENGETLVQEVQEVYEAGTNENGEITQIAIQAYEGAEGFSVVEQMQQATEKGAEDFSVVEQMEQTTQDIQSTGPGYRYSRTWPHLANTAHWPLANERHSVFLICYTICIPDDILP